MKIIIIILLLIIILINLIYNKNSSHSTIIKQPKTINYKMYKWMKKLFDLNDHIKLMSETSELQLAL